MRDTNCFENSECYVQYEDVAYFYKCLIMSVLLVMVLKCDFEESYSVAAVMMTLLRGVF